MLCRNTKEAPSIAYDSLTSEVHYQGGQRGVHAGRDTDEAIKRVITQGINPSGKELDPTTPRWKMMEDELAEILTYLKITIDRTTSSCYHYSYGALLGKRYRKLVAELIV